MGIFGLFRTLKFETDTGDAYRWLAGCVSVERGFCGRVGGNGFGDSSFGDILLTRLKRVIKWIDFLFYRFSISLGEVLIDVKRIKIRIIVRSWVTVGFGRVLLGEFH